MQKNVVFAIVVLVLMSASFVYRNRVMRRATAIHQVAYQSSLAHFQAVLPLGMHREDVVRYLDSHSLVYVASSKDVLVKIGEESGKFPICKKWVVYVSLRFNHKMPQVEPTPQDNLGSIAIQKSGVCL